MGGGGSGGGGRRAFSSMSGRYPRSWHPSPFASDDEVASTDEPQFYKEEKKNRIKMEIARRRQQIEENACLHDELTRLAKLRETAEISDRLNVIPNAYGGTPMSGMSPAMAAAAAAAGVSVATSTGTSVLKSVDEILRSGHNHLNHGVNTSMANHLGQHGGGVSHQYNDLYNMTSSYGGDHHRVTDFSPINSDMIHDGHHRMATHYRSSSADPALSGYGGGGGINNYMSSSMDPYGGKYSKYGGTAAGSSSLYTRKY